MSTDAKGKNEKQSANDEEWLAGGGEIKLMSNSIYTYFNNSYFTLKVIFFIKYFL